MENYITAPGPIGVFDSGYGGLTVLRDIRCQLPEYDYIYLGDNARAPYGTRSFDLVYRFTLDAVEKLFGMGCHLVVLACNTASAKALRSIQQVNLPQMDPERRVLGVIRPTAEAVGRLSANGHVGILGTPGTVMSGSYGMEIGKLYPDFTVTEHACPMWVPLVENREADKPGADYFVRQEVERLFVRDPEIDTVVLGCTHYPLLYDKIRRYVPQGVTIVPQGNIVASSLADYLRRHPEMDAKCTRGGTCTYFTTENPDKFSGMASEFMSCSVEVSHCEV